MMIHRIGLCYRSFTLYSVLHVIDVSHLRPDLDIQSGFCAFPGSFGTLLVMK